MTIATLNDLQAACPGASADFLADQLGKQATVAAAQTAYIGTLQATIRERDADIAALTEDRDDLKAQIAAIKATTGGHSAKPEGLRSPGGGGSARAEAESLVSDLMTERKLTRSQAWSRVMRENPSLQERIVAEANTGKVVTNA